MKPKTAIDLDLSVAQGCQAPGCTSEHGSGIFIHGACHLFGRMSIYYDSVGKTITVRCRECNGPIITIAVKPE